MKTGDMERGVQGLIQIGQSISKLIWVHYTLFVQWQHKEQDVIQIGLQATSYICL